MLLSKPRGFKKLLRKMAWSILKKIILKLNDWSEQFTHRSRIFYIYIYVCVCVCVCVSVRVGFFFFISLNFECFHNVKILF